jgi:cysteine desulfurase
LTSIYLDYNATTPIHPEVADAMLPFLRGGFGNPSSSHSYGIEARAAVERARASVASLLRCGAEEVIFTSGGTESNNAAIKGFAFAHRDHGRHIITSQVEHPAVLEVCSYLEQEGFEVTCVGVDHSGLVSPEEVARAMRPETILITVMLANNEVGTIEPVAEIAAMAAARNIAVHTDAAQAVGKIPVDVRRLNVDMLSVAGHKLYAPKGVGALFVRCGTDLQKFMHGAAHERNLRAGTENVLEVVGLGKACEIAARDLADVQTYTASMRDMLQQGLEARLPACHINGHLERRLPNTLSVSFAGVDASALLRRLPGVACSAGAACHADTVTVSHVLKAMRLPAEVSRGTIRLSTGRMTNPQEIASAIDQIVEACLAR